MRQRRILTWFFMVQCDSVPRVHYLMFFKKIYNQSEIFAAFDVLTRHDYKGLWNMAHFPRLQTGLCEAPTHQCVRNVEKWWGIEFCMN